MPISIGYGKNVKIAKCLSQLAMEKTQKSQMPISNRYGKKHKNCKIPISIRYGKTQKSQNAYLN